MEEVRIYRRGSFLAFFVMLGVLSVAKWALFSLWERGGVSSLDEENAFFLSAAEARKSSSRAGHSNREDKPTSVGTKQVERTVATLHRLNPGKAAPVERKPLEVRVCESLPVDLNRADTAQLKRIRGIGSYTAAHIVSYRELLGGFVSVAQLEEIPGVRLENIRMLVEKGYADTILVRPIDLNNASLKELQRHPYLSFRQAKAIVELRNQRRHPIRTDDLSFLEEFQVGDMERLRPYLPH